ncbi:outer membrane protein assembly factor BamB family protein [Kitasatospora griseola]|uniref:outer membrane protein assembly factor BamB family protein n=1 Tax=Kitasatospora griseola TaxID=2064 RepID=UPI00382E82B0
MGRRTDSGAATGTAVEPLTGWRRALGLVLLITVPIAALVGLGWVFLGSSGYWPGSSMTTAWEATDEGGPAADFGGRGTWLVGDSVVRGRYDAVTGFDAATGGRRWQYLPPRRTDICAVSPTADGSLLLIAYGSRATAPDSATGQVPEGAGCSTVAALDLADGRELWHAPRVPEPESPGNTHAEGLLAAGGGLGVVLDAGKDARAVRALDLRTGTPRWTAAVPAGCSPDLAATAPQQVLVLLTCGDEEKLAAFDPADGKQRWTVPLDARRGVDARARASFTATEPIVVRVDGSAPGFLAFGPDGRPTARIAAGGARYGTIGSAAAVADGRLYARTDGGRWGRIAAFDLATGNQLWQSDLGGARSTVSGLHAQGGKVMALLTSTKYGDSLHVFDADTGDEVEDRAFRDHVGPADTLILHRDLVIAVRPDDPHWPFSAFRRW